MERRKKITKNYFNHDYPFISSAHACSTTSFGSCQFAERRNRILCAGNFNTVCGKCFACYFVSNGDCGCRKYLFGICAAWLLTKFSFRGKQILATLIDIPFSISPVIVGLSYLMTFGRLGWFYPAIRAFNQFFGTNIRITFAIPGVVLATILLPSRLYRERFFRC